MSKKEKQIHPLNKVFNNRLILKKANGQIFNFDKN